MHKANVGLTRTQVEKAQTLQNWNVGNEVLYRLCREHRKHIERGTVASKVWLIGRSYAASIERHMNGDIGGEQFILNKVAPRLMGWRLDDWLSEAMRQRSAFSQHPEIAVMIHARMLRRLEPLLKRVPRSFVSKYLHFHRRNLFPIYDSRAVAAIRLLTPDLRQSNFVSAAHADEPYRNFCGSLHWLLQQVEKRFGLRLSLREADNLLLEIYRRHAVSRDPTSRIRLTHAGETVVA